MVKVGLVGCGRISNRHVDAILANKGKVKIAWVCDKKEERAKALAEKLGCNYCTNYLDLNGKGLDVVSVLTPSGLHPRHVCAIAEQVDAPNILCEKPLSLTLREAYEVYRRVEKAGKRLIPVYQNRFNPIVQMMKKLIDSGKLGKIHQFCCNVFWNRNDAYFAIDWHGTREFDGGTYAVHHSETAHKDVEAVFGLNLNVLVTVEAEYGGGTILQSGSELAGRFGFKVKPEDVLDYVLIHIIVTLRSVITAV
mgnify:CR=1 FL=1